MSLQDEPSPDEVFQTKEELEGYLEARYPEWWKGCPVGRLNIYSCDSCRCYIVTIDVDRGTTPMFLGCRATEGCSGTMASHGYPDPDTKPDNVPAPWGEWYRPEPGEYMLFGDDPEIHDYVLRGGLLLRDRKATDGQASEAAT